MRAIRIMFGMVWYGLVWFRWLVDRRASLVSYSRSKLLLNIHLSVSNREFSIPFAWNSLWLFRTLNILRDFLCHTFWFIILCWTLSLFFMLFSNTYWFDIVIVDRSFLFLLLFSCCFLSCEKHHLSSVAVATKNVTFLKNLMFILYLCLASQTRSNLLTALCQLWIKSSWHQLNAWKKISTKSNSWRQSCYMNKISSVTIFSHFLSTLNHSYSKRH